MRRVFLAWALLSTASACDGGTDGGRPGLDGGAVADSGTSMDSGPADPPDGSASSDAATPIDAWMVPPVPDAGEARPLPDISSVSVDCSAFTLSDPARAREIYDEYLGDALPQTEEDFGWHVDETLVSREIVERLTSYGVSSSHTTEELHALFDFDPSRYDRVTSRSNWDIFGEIDPAAEREGPYRRFNPHDWLPATATHYGRGDSTDVMATQFVFRIGCYREEMERIFTVCPDCVDGMVALSRNDIHQIFDLRFVRVRDGLLEVSRQFRTFSIDASGHDVYFTDDMYRYRFATFASDDVLRAFRRLEISGRMAQNLGTYGGPTAVLIRSDPASEYVAP